MIRWKRSKDGYVDSHCGHWSIRPMYGGSTTPQWFDLHRDAKLVRRFCNTQRDAEAAAEEIVWHERRQAAQLEAVATAFAAVGRAIRLVLRIRGRDESESDARERAHGIWERSERQQREREWHVKQLSTTK